jgi:TetR/AcrR family transcriptional regulator, transcriptional repressor of aconitase
MPKISDQAKARRRAQIIADARRCFARYGYEGATLPQLEKATGLTRGGIFHYFEDKQALFVAAAAASAERLQQIWENAGLSGLLEALGAEDPAWIAVQLEASIRARTDRSLQRALQDHTEAQRAQAPQRLERLRPHVRDDIPVEQIAMFLTALVNGLALRRATGDALPDPATLNELITSAVGPRR